MKPDSVWFYPQGSLTPSAWKAREAILGESDPLKQQFAAVALNAEHKSCAGSLALAQIQAVAPAMVGLCERIKIQHTAQEDHQSEYKELAQYYFIFWPTYIQLWRLTKTNNGQFEAWQLDLGRKITFSAKDDLKRFVKIWNTLISNLVGPVFQSLESDLEAIGDKLSNKTQTRAKRKANKKEIGKSSEKPCAEKADGQRKVLRRSERLRRN
ncbi:MAG: hypothetical protein M1836_006979 [Candelina mexicana]|nr:MAG: hypothetical protein M1836_006979 [Candelina mexicana]